MPTDRSSACSSPPTTFTSPGDAEARRLAAEAGFDEHLVKPVDPDTLGDLLRAA
jgi:DNA-binding response OmpR family regulator